MGQNSPKPAETGSADTNAINGLRAWLDREGGNQRVPQVLDLLARQTARAWTNAQPSPAFDADTLRRLYHDAHGGLASDMPASRWLKRREVERWWEARLASLAQALRSEGLEVLPDLKVISGGGSGNPTQYRFDLVPLDEQAEGAGDEGESDNGGTIRYESEHAIPSWWLRPILGTNPFRMRSVRGYTLTGLLLTEGLLLLVLWGLALVIMSAQRPATTADLSLLVVLTIASWIWWFFMQPLIRLPRDRLTVGNDLLLGWSQLHGQFRLVRDSQSKHLGGWFRLERNYAVCPVCSGTIELEDGRHAFPGRVVGRCGDSPTEHVFSFDPVTMSGRRLNS